MKKVIGIDINEILRARSMQFDRFYNDEFNGEGLPPEDDPYKFDLRNDYLWEDTTEVIKILNEDLPDDINSLDYQINEETGVAPVDSLAFKEEKNFITAEEKFKKFLYEDYLFEIHGSAPLLYRGLDKHLEELYMKYKDQFDFVIISKENWFTIPPTLFFLSKLMSRITTYKFVENNKEIWNNVDFLITTDPYLLDVPRETNKDVIDIRVPINKRVIKLSRPYNENHIGDIEKLQLYDLINDDEFEKLIGYKKPDELLNTEKDKKND